MSDQIDAALDLQAAKSSMPVGADPIDHALDVRSTGSITPIKAEESDELGDEARAETGAGEMALSLGTGAVASFPAAAAYVAGALGFGKGSLENSQAVQSALTFQPRTSEGKGGLEGLNKVAGAPGRFVTSQLDEIEPSGTLSGIVSDVGERTMAVAPLLSEGTAALAGGGVTRSLLSRAKPEEAPALHPLQDIAEAEAQKLKDVDSRLASQGITLPSNREISPIVRQSNNVVAKDLNLPQDAPLTEGMIEAGIKKNALPDYAEVRKIAPWETSSTYENDIRGINTNLIDEDIRPPLSGDLSGPETVRLSQNLRNRATAYYRASEQNPAFRPVAQAHDAAAEAIENEFERHMEDVPGVAQSWDAARTYIAKAKNVEAALDGGGNVRPTMLKSQMLKGKPLSGGIQDLAIAAAKYPDYFKSTPALPLQVSLPRRVAAKMATPLGAAGGAFVGSQLGLPTLGAAIGGEAGTKLSTLLNPNQR